MNKPRIKIGILGCGIYSTKAASLIYDSGQYEIVACMDVNELSASNLAQKYTAKAYSRLNLFLKHPDMQAVSINTPVPVHAENIKSCLCAGKNVFITKPVTSRVNDAIEMVSLAKEKKLSFMVGHHTTYKTFYQYANTLITSKSLGRVCNCIVTCCSGTALESGNASWRIDGGKNPGGPLLQCGVHLIHYLLSLFGQIHCVCSFMQDNITPNDAVDNTITLLEFRNGIHVTFICNYATAYLHTMQFCGTEANLHILEHVKSYGSEEIYLQRRKKNEFEPWECLTVPKASECSYSGDYILERTFAEQIRNGIPDYENINMGINALRVIEAAVKSNKERRVIFLD